MFLRWFRTVFGKLSTAPASIQPVPAAAIQTVWTNWPTRYPTTPHCRAPTVKPWKPAYGNDCPRIRTTTQNDFQIARNISRSSFPLAWRSWMEAFGVNVCLFVFRTLVERYRVSWHTVHFLKERAGTSGSAISRAVCEYVLVLLSLSINMDSSA